MKIDEKKYFGLKYLSYRKTLQKFHLKDFLLAAQEIGKNSYHAKNVLNDNHIIDLLKNDKPDNIFFITQTAQKNSISKIKLSNNTLKELDFLSRVNSEMNYYIINEKEFFIIENNNEYIFFYYLKEIDNGEVVFLPMFYSFLEVRKYVPHTDFIDDNKAVELYDSLMKHFIYLMIGEMDVKFIKSNQKMGTKKDGYKNNSSHDFSIVDDYWNTIIINNNGFNVSGHFRLQPCGENMMDRKLIWIDSYKKQGYIRGLKK